MEWCRGGPCSSACGGSASARSGGGRRSCSARAAASCLAACGVAPSPSHARPPTATRTRYSNAGAAYAGANNACVRYAGPRRTETFAPTDINTNLSFFNEAYSYTRFSKIHVCARQALPARSFRLPCTLAV